MEDLLRITYLKTESPHLVGRATPDAAGKARPTVNHLTVMNYVKLNNQRFLRYNRWIPAFAGMTEFEFLETSSVSGRVVPQQLMQLHL